ncbi:hypothetical protein GKE62_06225 [Novosphingobium sp. Gsoil 351]|nr:hypothetical protein GKE62_06225 [Novosphingobium sp. Gsoil 351]
MRFHPSEEQVAIQEAVKGTLADVWSIQQLHTFADGAADFDPASWKALMALGIGTLTLPEDMAGAGLGLLDAALVCESIGEAAAPGPVIGQIITAMAVTASDNPEARRFLPQIAENEVVATLALGSGLVQSARVAQLFLADAPDGGLLLIEAGEGVTIEPLTPTDLSRPVSRVSFEGAKSHRLCGGGDPLTARIRDAALVLIAADALGGAQRVTDMSVTYAKERVQFGQPIGRFQGLKHQLAHMALDVESARALVWYAAYAWDAHLQDASRAAALAKAHLCEVYTRATRAAIAAHGGIGYTWEYGLNYWFRRSVYDRAWLGSPAHHRARGPSWQAGDDQFAPTDPGSSADAPGRPLYGPIGNRRFANARWGVAGAGGSGGGKEATCFGVSSPTEGAAPRYSDPGATGARARRLRFRCLGGRRLAGPGCARRVR